MATDTTREQPPTPTVATGLEEADAKLVVATGHGDCQKLKDLVQQQDPPTTTLVVMASSKQASPQKSSRASMHPLLAAAACRGNLEELSFLLSRVGGPEQEPSKNLGQGFLNQATAYSCGNCTNNTTSSLGQATAADVEQGATTADAVPHLNGVTVQGDTVLHLLAANGEEHNFLDCANFIHGLEEGLLSKENNNGDTPLHCAARAGKKEMVSRLIALARGAGILVQNLLRKENKRKETALHEAVRIGDDQLVIELLRADGKLACFPQEGTSPLYLAISLGRAKTAETLHDESENELLSYSGPDGQNALHAAVLRGPELTRMVLKWNTNKELTTERDKNGSTPLHFAAGATGKKDPIGDRFARVPDEPLLQRVIRVLAPQRRISALAQVLEANPAAVYEPDNDGLYPIHVAASVGAKQAIALIVDKCGSSSAGLRDAKGRTFLHVAVDQRKLEIVGYACGNGSLAWIMNMQDDDGNTALHLAVQAGKLRTFCALVGNRHVALNLANAKGETPLDIAHYKIPLGLFYNQNSDTSIWRALETVDAMSGTRRRDHHFEHHRQIHGRQIEYQEEKKEDIKESTQTLCIGSVLIATVTFGATFALPGGYRADDHTDGGTPTLVGRYAFDAFVMANTLAFILSSVATVLLIQSGTSYLNIRRRQSYYKNAFYLVQISVTCLAAAFALALYVVLGSVARRTAIAACVLSLLVVLCSDADFWLTLAIVARPLFVRRGALRSILLFIRILVVAVLLAFWPFIVIFLWAAYGRNHPIAILESPAPAPAPLS